MLVLDCCAAVEIARATPLGLAMAQDLAREDKVISSALLCAELAHAYQRYAQGGFITAAKAVEYLRQSLQLVDEFVDMSENSTEVLAESIHLGHSSYNLFYFTLARRNACKLLTVDKKLAALCAQNQVECATFAELD